MTPLEAELARRAAESAAAASRSSRPPPPGGTDWKGIALVIGAISAMGASVIVPLALRQPPPPDVSGLASRAQTTTMTDEIAACRRTAGDALSRATDAESQVKGLDERLGSLETAKKPKSAARRPPAASGATP